MNAPHDRHCSRTEAVLALYLDGDIGAGSAEDSGFELACTESLASHLRDCAACHVSLQRARRLDALLAESAGRTMAETSSAEAADRLLAAAIARTASTASAAAGTAAETVSPAQRRELSVLVPALLLVVATAGLASLWMMRREASPAPGETATVSSQPVSAQAVESQAVDSQTVESQAVESQTVESHAVESHVVESQAVESQAVESASIESGHAVAGAGDVIRVADEGVRRLRDRTARRRAAAATAARDRAERLSESAARLADATLAPDARVVAVERLLESSRPGTAGSGAALGVLIHALAVGRGEPRALSEAFEIARSEVHLAGYLRTTLRRMEAARRPVDDDDLAALTVAVRFDARNLDAAVRRVVRRHDAALEVVAAALRLPVRDRGGAALLLDCWSDLARRTDLDDGAVARRLFAGQPRRVFAELEEELAATSAVPRRVRCLLGLASSNDQQSASALLAWATASCRKEAYAAAWSLSQLPHAWLEEAGRRAARDRGAFVLRAALARSGLPAARAWTDPLRLTAAERAALDSASFALFPRVAEWFRGDPRRRPTIAED